MRLAVVNGPNLNLLGTREPALYGSETLADIESRISVVARDLGAQVEFLQRNSEGDLIDFVQGMAGRIDGAVVNAGAYSHTSLALRDAFAAVGVPFVEVHITNVHAREPERHRSMLAPISVGQVTGLGTYGYELALRGLVARLGRPNPDRRVSQHTRRLSVLLEGLTAAHLDGLLLTSLPNIRYLTGFSGTSALLFVSHRETLLITDFRYETQVRDEVADGIRVVIDGQSLWTGLWGQLGQQQSVSVVGFESANLLHRDFQRLLEQGSRYQWRPTLDLVERLRERKDEGEVALIARAAEVACDALGAAIGEIRGGLTELAVVGVLERALRDAGSEDYPFPSIVASGARSALPHARSTGRVIVQGDLLLMDFGAVVGGYCSDVTRTFVIGPAATEQREVHEVVRVANERASAAVRPGMTGRDADAVARDYIERCGFGELFGHSLGHGVGLEVHEAPRLARAAEGALPEGAVVTIEPGVYRPGWGGVRIEDDVHLTHDGPRILTSFTRELVELG